MHSGFEPCKWKRGQVLKKLLTASGRITVSWATSATLMRERPHSQFHGHNWENGKAENERENE